MCGFNRYFTINQNKHFCYLSLSLLLRHRQLIKYLSDTTSLLPPIPKYYLRTNIGTFKITFLHCHVLPYPSKNLRMNTYKKTAFTYVVSCTKRQCILPCKLTLHYNHVVGFCSSSTNVTDLYVEHGRPWHVQ